MGGFESATHINRSGQRLDMMAGVHHDRMAKQDYDSLRSVGIRTVRDGIRWNQIDRRGKYDFSSFLPMLEAAHDSGVQVIWTLFHYGFPDDLDIFSEEFVERFASYCQAAAAIVRDSSGEVAFYTPINEINFFAWAASRDLIFPHALGRDDELKRQLVRATIAACRAILAVDSQARFVYSEPLINVVAPLDNPELIQEAQAYTDSQFGAWDMLAGCVEPELGGSRRYLDILGVNFYHSNQWEVRNGRLRWEDETRDSRWVPLHKMLQMAQERYHRPICITETSHFGSGRARWILETAMEVALAIKSGVPVEGVCLYPIIDRFDWEDASHWHNSGLWDIAVHDGEMTRVLNAEYGEAFEQARLLLADLGLS